MNEYEALHVRVGAIAVEPAVAAAEREAAAAVYAGEERVHPAGILQDLALQRHHHPLGRTRDVRREGRGLFRLFSRDDRGARVLRVNQGCSRRYQRQDRHQEEREAQARHSMDSLLIVGRHFECSGCTVCKRRTPMRPPVESDHPRRRHPCFRGRFAGIATATGDSSLRWASLLTAGRDRVVFRPQHDEPSL